MKKWKWRLAQWLEIRWWKNYLQGKEPHEYKEWKLGYWNGLLQKVQSFIKVKETDSVIDLGCGPAGIFMAFPHCKVTAVDPLLAEYEKHLPVFKQTNYPNVRFVSLPMEDYVADSDFDVVFCMNAINHVKDIEKAYDVITRVAGEKASLLMSVDAHRFSFFKYLFRLLPGDALHPHQYDIKEYCAFLEKRNWEIGHCAPLKSDWFFTHYLLVAKRISA